MKAIAAVKHKKLTTLMLLGLIVALLLVGCTGSGTESGQAATDSEQAAGTSSEEGTEAVAAAAPALEIYTSIYPLYYFTERIGGDRVSTTMVVPPGVEAHDFEPAAKLVGEITSADMFIYNGLGLEHWAENLLAQLPQDVVTVETTIGIETHSMEEALAGHDHEHEVTEGEAAAGEAIEGEGAEGEEGHSHEGGIDPHVWIDPAKALQQAERILEALVKADSEGAAVYQANFEALKADLLALDEAFKASLSGLERREIVVGHAAFGYLVERYGLTQLPISGLSPLEEPSASELGALSKLVKEHQVTTIFYETLASPKFSEVLAAETGTKTAVLNPLEGLTQEELDAGEDYLSIMRKNLEALKAALAN